MEDIFLTWIIIYISCVVSSVTSVMLSKIIKVEKGLKLSSIFYYASVSLLISGLVVCVTFILYAVIMLSIVGPLGLAFS